MFYCTADSEKAYWIVTKLHGFENWTFKNCEWTVVRHTCILTVWSSQGSSPQLFERWIKLLTAYIAIQCLGLVKHTALFSGYRGHYMATQRYKISL